MTIAKVRKMSARVAWAFEGDNGFRCPTEIVQRSICRVHAVAAALMAVAMRGTSTENIPSPRWLMRFVLFRRRVTFGLLTDFFGSLHCARFCAGFRNVRFFIDRVMMND